jgi:hypothetical protein
MKSPMASAAAALLLAACGGTRSSSPAPETPPEVPPPAAETKSPAPESPVPEPGAPEPPPGTEPAQGRMAFIRCDPEHRPEMCTKEYRPVCGEVDNGVRCVTTPCPSTDKKNFGNACTACADPKTIGHWPVRCEDLGNDVGAER